MDRREFLVGAAAAAVAGPVVAQDGVALTSMAHPGSLAYNFGWTETIAANVAKDLTEDSLLEMLVELERGWDRIAIARFVVPPEMRDMLKPGRWEITANEAPRSSEDQPG